MAKATEPADQAAPTAAPAPATSTATAPQAATAAASSAEREPIKVAVVQPKESEPRGNTPPAFEGPDPGPGSYRISLPNTGDPVIVDAPSRADAWAKYCDGRKVYPSPKTAGLTIEKIHREIVDPSDEKSPSRWVNG